MVWLIYSDEELLAAKRNRLAVNQTFSGRCFAGCLPFFRVRQGGVLEKQEAAAEEAVRVPLLTETTYTDSFISLSGTRSSCVQQNQCTSRMRS